MFWRLLKALAVIIAVVMAPTGQIRVNPVGGAHQPRPEDRQSMRAQPIDFPSAFNATRLGQTPSETFQELPESPFKEELMRLPAEARQRALEQFNELGIALVDAPALHVSDRGMLHYSCFTHDHPEQAQSIFLEESAASLAAVQSAAIPVATPPTYNSKPDAPYVIYLDFNGAVISGTEWNTQYNAGSDFDAYAWSSDTDYTTFSDSEQAAIRRIWQRISEDYAPFDVNVSTDIAYDPDNTGGSANIGWILFTRDEDINGTAMPRSGAGGVAWVNVFGSSYYPQYSPALVYADNLGPHVEHFMAEAGSHEMGHNMGLSHDGTSTSSYYAGHGEGETDWAPIMGSSYYENISTWSKGEYFDASQTQDDLGIIAGKTGYRPDDYGETPKTAALLLFEGNTIRGPSTRDFVGDDANEGIISSPADVDMFRFETGGGSISIHVDPFKAEETRHSLGNNLDLKVILYDSSQTVVAISDSTTTATASISTSLPEGTYYLSVEGTGYGSPMADPPSGYTGYGSLGMYFISGTATQPLALDNPGSGTTWEPGKTYAITWRGTSAGDSVSVDLYKAGSPLSNVFSGLDGSLNSYSWSIPQELLNGSDYSLRLTVNGDPLQSVESDPFAISVIAPYVVLQEPAADALSAPGITAVSVTFSESMDTSSFSLSEDLRSFTGPGGIDLSTQVTGYAWDAAQTRLTLQFQAQSEDGYYRIVICDEILDTDGHPVDQDGDGYPGEFHDDSNPVVFRIVSDPVSGVQTLYYSDMETDPLILLGDGWEWGLPSQGALGGPDVAWSGSRVLAVNLSGSYDPGLDPPIHATLPAISTRNVSGVVLEFHRWLGVEYRETGSPSTRHSDFATVEYSVDGYNWISIWSNSDKLLDNGWLLQSLALPAAASNQETLHLRFGLQSDGSVESFGWNLDDVHVSGTLEEPVSPPPPPVILAHNLGEQTSGSVSVIYIEFSQPMDTGTFSLSDVKGFIGPAGSIQPTSFAWISDTVLEILFPEQSLEGAYNMEIAPTLTDLFNQMIDQDKDLQAGEDPDDVYQASFSIGGGSSLSPAESWRETYFGTTLNTGDAADNHDYDNDGCVNILERAFGTDPTLPSSVFVPAQKPLISNGVIYLSITYRRIAGGTGTTGTDYTVDGLRYTVQFSDSINGTWNPANISVVSIDGPVDGMETVTVRLSTSLASGSPQFIRLQVTSSP